MVQRIGEEYRKGRLLLIMTTNLDAGQECIWNIGAIAASGKPGARELIIKILMASSAIPAVFPPVMIDVEVNGEQRQEMHVDGGVFAQAFLYPPGIDAAAARRWRGTAGRQRDAYIIRNGRLLAAETNVKRRTLPIASRAVSMMIGTSGVNDMIRIYALTRRDHVGYHLAYIDKRLHPALQGPLRPGLHALAVPVRLRPRRGRRRVEGRASRLGAVGAPGADTGWRRITHRSLALRPQRNAHASMLHAWAQ